MGLETRRRLGEDSDNIRTRLGEDSDMTRKDSEMSRKRPRNE
jgi:hypothetical protein